MPSHEIFNKPLKVNLTFEDIPTPENYFELAGPMKVEKTTKVWRVQTKKYPEIDPGLVSTHYGFGDSPDAEVISSGLNSKEPESVALARHGNFFLWGFSASPTDMTPEARKCFVNAVCYIKKFDGQKPIVRKARWGYTRDVALSYAYRLRIDLDESLWRSHLPDSFRNDPQRYARYRQSVLENFTRWFPEEVRRRFGNDWERYVRWVEDNLAYLRFEGESYNAVPVVDEDVKSLGLSNRKVKLLDKCVAMLEQGDRPELARRILKRYTSLDFPDAKGWRSWLEKNRDCLFFTDAGGFKFMVAPRSMVISSRLPAGTIPGSSPKEPDAEDPVVAEAGLSPARVGPGAVLDLVIRVRTAPAWHIYAAGEQHGPGIPTTLSLKLPEGVKAEGEWVYPEPERGRDGQMIHQGTFEFRRHLRVGAGVAPGPLSVGCEFGYQTCDPHSCRPPRKVALEAGTEVVRPSSQ